VIEFGVSVPNFREVASPRAIRRVAEVAEELGFAAIWTTDHIVLPSQHIRRFGGEPYYELLTTLSYLAGITSRVRLGTSVVVLPYRHPLLVAKQVATIDQLSDGRLILGVAAGWMEEEFAALGAPFHQRGAYSDEALEVFRRCWSEERPAFTGRFTHFADIAFQPKPVQRPGPPIWVGGVSRVAIRRAVRYGDGWHINEQPLDAIRSGLAMLREECGAQRRDPGNLVLSLRWPLVFEDGVDPSWPGPRLEGDSARVAQTVRTLEALGIRHLLLDFPGADLPAIERRLRRFAAEVMPPFAAS